MDNIRSNINFIYRVNDYKFFSFDDFYESYGFNIFIILFFISVIFYLLIKIELKIYRKNWASLKCHPKYLYISGFIQREGTLGPINSTFHNYNECINEGVSDAIDEMNTESYYTTKNQLGRIDYVNQKINDKYKVYHNNIKQIEDKINLPEDIMEKLDLTIDSKSAGYYNQLKLMGIYIDQIDAAFSYFYEYIRNYLSYLFYNFKQKAANSEDGSSKKTNNENKANNVLKILNTHFDGVNF